jgi:thioredoxin-related protein
MVARTVLSFVLGLAVIAPVSAADQLVMFEQAGCPYCAAWNHDVGGIYAKTDEAQIVPLRRVDIHADRPADLRTIGEIHFTPTFVVMHCGHETARLVGYSGQDNFWGLLDRDLADLKGAAPCRT